MERYGGDYVIPLNDQATEALSFEPLQLRTGWARYFPPESDDAWALVLVRFGFPPPAEAEWTPDGYRGPIRVRDLWVSVERTEVLSALARSLPFGRFESAVNQPRHYAALAPHLRPHRMVAPPTEEERQGLWCLELPTIVNEKPELRLTIPEGQRRKPDDFYQQVADVFAWLATTSRSPAEDLAKFNDVKVTTVHRWVREARARGLLAPATGRGSKAASSVRAPHGGPTDR